jgi:hypothetical protein
MKAQATKFLLVLLVTACSVGCYGIGPYGFDERPERLDSFLGLTNVRVLAKGPLVVYSMGIKDVYSNVMLGSPASPYDGNFPFFIALPNSRILDLSDPRVVDIFRTARPGPPSYGDIPSAYKFRHDDRTVRGSTEYWPEGTERLQWNDYVLYAKDGELLGLTIHTNSSRARHLDEAMKSRVGSSPDALTAIPFSGAAYREMFGEPDEIFETFSM